jgi:hypothetical protein
MKLEYGKRYVTRDGRVTGPLEENRVGCWEDSHPFHDPVTKNTWTQFGRWSPSNKDNKLDLVSEYIDPAAPKCKRETHGGGGCPSPRTCPVHGEEPCVDVDSMRQWKPEPVVTLDELKAQLDRIEAKLADAKPAELLVPVKCATPVGWKPVRVGHAKPGDCYLDRGGRVVVRWRFPKVSSSYHIILEKENP